MTEKTRKFSMKLPIVSSGECSIIIDGIDMTDKVREVRISAGVDELTTVTLVLGAGVDVEGEAIVKLLDFAGDELEVDNED